MTPGGATKVEVPEWLRTHYELVDAGALDEYMEDFADDAELRFGADPVVKGKEAIRARLAAGHAARRAQHDYHNVWEADGTTIVEFDARYTFPDGSTRTVDVQQGVARYVPGMVHAEENIGDTDAHALLVEIKGPAKE